MPNATKESKIAKIISAAEVLIDEKGVFDFSFKELSKLSGVSNGSLYREFQSKDELLCTIFTNKLKKHIQVMDYLHQAELTGKEKIISHVYYTYFSIKNDEASVADRFLITNYALYKNARPEFTDEMKKHIEILTNKFLYQYTSLKESKIINASLTQAKRQMIYMQIVTRGLNVIAGNRYTPKRKIKLDMLIPLLTPILDDLEWTPGPSSEYDINKIQVTVNTLSDKGFINVS
ncbi:TetR/AcrR family transcriptional regulator [Shewanella atlantica]|uniref:TetR/AcrR family transcriptional regulator n=1 Tax=Shewanella atlantica TaxID=271099 RepID=A0A3S0IXJ0_9GAMM|nr:TetR/AcrR family transcriptional regulator [Shewanella atlantica]RTR33579.1 TetR/AcrR family transcriptional regulator [Shewanella atlantica]